MVMKLVKRERRGAWKNICNGLRELGLCKGCDVERREEEADREAGCAGYRRIIASFVAECGI